MPYIAPERRAVLVTSVTPDSVGELNFAISHLVHRYIAVDPLSYTLLNAVIGVLDCAKMELYRTVASPYEDGKRRENGSVSDLDREINQSEQYSSVRSAIAQAFGLQDAENTATITAKDAENKPAKEPATNGVPQVLSVVPAQVNPAEQPANVSAKRRPAQVVGESPMAGVEAPTATVAAASKPKGHEPVALDKHVLSVWERAAQGNGEDEDDI